MRVKIYSNEHTAWWKENYFGYTNNESEAGIFEIEEVNKKYPYIDFDTTKEDYLVKFEGLTYEKLEKENQELKDKLQLTETARQLLYNELKCCNGMAECAQKLKEVIKFLGEQLGLDVDLENHNLITDEGTIGFVNADEETMSILELLREVIEDGNMGKKSE